MGGIIDLLALLDGRDYRTVQGTLTVFPGVDTEVFAEKVPGWVLEVNMEATDAYAYMEVDMPPETFPVLAFTLADLAAVGLTTPVSQVLTLTNFTFPGLPVDSSGFGAAFFNLIYPLPLKKENIVHIFFSLEPGTTQASATVNYSVYFAQIYRMDLFQKSLKDLLNVKKAPVLL